MSGVREGTPNESGTPISAPSLGEEIEERVAEIIERCPTRESALLPLLWLCQKHWGWLSPEMLSAIADRLQLSPTTVESVASFYTMLYLEPPAKYVIQVCRSLPCHLLESHTLSEHLQKKLGIGFGEKTEDQRFALVKVHCLGACDGAAVVRINDQEYRQQTPETVDRLLDSLP